MTFSQLYDNTIRKLDDELSSLIDSGSDFELEKNGDVLVIIFPDDSKFIITPNSPVNQLWVSANYEGHRFNIDEMTSGWTDEKSGEGFGTYLSRLLTEKLDQPVTLST